MQGHRGTIKNKYLHTYMYNPETSHTEVEDMSYGFLGQSVKGQGYNAIKIICKIYNIPNGIVSKKQQIYKAHSFIKLESGYPNGTNTPTPPPCGNHF